MGFCDDCKNNVKGICQNIIRDDGSHKIVSHQQKACGLKGSDVIRDDRVLYPSQKSELELLKERIEVLEKK